MRSFRRRSASTGRALCEVGVATPAAREEQRAEALCTHRRARPAAPAPSMALVRFAAVQLDGAARFRAAVVGPAAPQVLVQDGACGMGMARPRRLRPGGPRTVRSGPVRRCSCSPGGVRRGMGAGGEPGRWALSASMSVVDSKSRSMPDHPGPLQPLAVGTGASEEEAPLDH
jgi:hypothetical protein